MEVRGLKRKDSQLLRVEAVPSLHRAGLLVNMEPIMGRCAWKIYPISPQALFIAKRGRIMEQRAGPVTVCAQGGTLH